MTKMRPIRAGRKPGDEKHHNEQTQIKGKDKTGGHWTVFAEPGAVYCDSRSTLPCCAAKARLLRNSGVKRDHPNVTVTKKRRENSIREGVQYTLSLSGSSKYM